MCSDTVISVSGLCKSYETYTTPRDRLKQFVFPPIQKLLGLEVKSYCEYFPALKNINFNVKQGETFGIIGLNGSGKSTLLQILCGTLSPSSGEVSVKGKVAALLELGSGFNPEFSGRENVVMSARLYGLTSEEIDSRFDQIVAFADIGDFIEKPVKTYSSGMYVRLAFSVIAHVDADILVIDEALSVGDAYFVQKCMRFLRGFMERGTLLFVSHDVGAVTSLCSRAMWLQKGELKTIGEPKEIIKLYLEGLVSQSQDIKAVKENTQAHVDNANDVQYVDMRDRFINASNLRNDIQIMPFADASDAFGAGGAKIQDAYIEDVKTSSRLSFTVGGELVRLIIVAEAIEDLDSVILGFDLKNRHGQTVFGDNTYLSYRTEPKNLCGRQVVKAIFEFYMPVMPVGDYAITVAIATGSQESHVQHHWVHDAVILRAQASRVCFGLVGVPMKNIQLIVS